MRGERIYQLRSRRRRGGELTGNINGKSLDVRGSALALGHSKVEQLLPCVGLGVSCDGFRRLSSKSEDWEARQVSVGMP